MPIATRQTRLALTRLDARAAGPTTQTAIEWALECQYVDKVVHGEGLVLGVLGVEWIGEGRIFHSDGRVYFEVVWCAYVWMPRAGELLLLTLESQSEQGMFLANEFIEDFYIPQKNMKSGEGEETRWDAARKRWVYVNRSGGRGFGRGGRGGRRGRRGGGRRV